MRNRFLSLLAVPGRFHFWGSLVIVVFVAVVISVQINDRRHFAASELHQDVVERWGAPIVQPVPSVRWVESGSVFNALEAMPLAGQDVTVEAAMNYRKRGLTYFSGFDFTFRGAYRVINREGKTIDLVFVFPIQMSKNKVLLSDLELRVNGEPARVDLAANADRLVWTGRLADGEELAVDIVFSGRGLDSFTYRLDPDLPVRDFRFAINVTGGDGFDYAAGVVPASATTQGADQVSLMWEYASLESGVPVGVILPSEKAFDHLIATMVRRSTVTFVLFFAAVIALAIHGRRSLRNYESYLAAAAYVFFFVLLAYLAAFLNFYLAYALSLAVIGALIYFYLRWILTATAGAYVLGAFVAFQVVPTVAVILQGYTGLIYTLEILAGLTGLMVLTTKPFFRRIADTILDPVPGQEVAHAQ